MTNIKIMWGSCQAPKSYSIYAQIYPHAENPVFIRLSDDLQEKNRHLQFFLNFFWNTESPNIGGYSKFSTILWKKWIFFRSMFGRIRCKMRQRQPQDSPPRRAFSRECSTGPRTLGRGESEREWRRCVTSDSVSVETSSICRRGAERYGKLLVILC